jgi:predicted helicase
MHLEEVLDWAGEALDRVDRASFFATFEQQHAVQYFYEPFLEAFDPELRKQLGVWYTPPEIVKYMVARVDQVLRSELDIADGLADPRVVVLDPCCGTGAYLVEVLNKIAATLREKGGDALIANDLKKAAMSRVFGFEILPAPFVISHLQIGLALDRFGAPFAEDGKERAGVFLTNALTGWEPPTEPKQHLLFPELEMERDAAADVKQRKPILVILGNPPYNIFAGAAIDEERELVEAYRNVHGVAPPGRGLNDLYVRFYRMAERRITEGKQGEGVVCFISNYSWLDGLSFTGMREHFLGAFDRIWIDCMNGDKYKTGKLTPEGQGDPSVFSTEHNREGIQVGTAIALLARRKEHEPADAIHFRPFWGKGKLTQLGSVEPLESAPYAEVLPDPAVGLPFAAVSARPSYLAWPRLTGLFPRSFPGLLTSRDDFVIDIDRESLEARVRRYFDPSVSDAEIAAETPSAIADASRFDGKQTRQRLVQRGFLPANVVRYAYRPFDNRWLYWEPETKDLSR